MSTLNGGPRPYINTNGLVLHLDAGNTASYPGSGSTWTDLSGYGNNATLTNGPTYSTDGGGSIYFDGTNDYAPIGTSGFPFGSSAGSLSAWVKSISENQYQWFITYGSAGGGTARFIGVVDYTSGVDLFVAGGYQSGACGPGSISCDNNFFLYTVPDTWFNLAASYDGAYSKLYLNGVLLQTYRVNWNTTSNNAQLARQVNGSEYMGGYIATAYNYNRALSDKEVFQNYNALKSRFGL
jgi:hypothetical protein